MTVLGAVSLAWVGGRHTFCLSTYGSLKMLQEVCDAGPQQILNRLLGGNWRVDDVRECLRLGLIGGGMEPNKAMALVEASANIDARWIENLQVAKAVLLSALTAAPKGDQVGKKSAGETETKATATGALSSPQSTEPAPPSA